MSNTSKVYWTAGELAPRWKVHRATVPRIMARFGCSGIKFASAKQAGRRFSAADVETVEKLAGKHLQSLRQYQPIAARDSVNSTTVPWKK